MLALAQFCSDHNPKPVYMQFPDGRRELTGWTCFALGHGHSRADCRWLMARAEDAATCEAAFGWSRRRAFFTAMQPLPRWVRP